MSIAGLRSGRGFAAEWPGCKVNPTFQLYECSSSRIILCIGEAWRHQPVVRNMPYGIQQPAVSGQIQLEESLG